jgi:hypothetical protein
MNGFNLWSGAARDQPQHVDTAHGQRTRLTKGAEDLLQLLVVLTHPRSICSEESMATPCSVKT